VLAPWHIRSKMMRKSLVPMALVDLCWLLPWHICSQHPCFSQNACAKEPAQLLSPDPDTHQVDRSVIASDGAGSLVSQFEDDERKGRPEDPFSLSFGDRGGISKVSLKGVCEHAQTREPAQGGDAEVNKQKIK